MQTVNPDFSYLRRDGKLVSKIGCNFFEKEGTHVKLQCSTEKREDSWSSLPSLVGVKFEIFAQNQFFFRL